MEHCKRRSPSSEGLLVHYSSAYRKYLHWRNYHKYPKTVVIVVVAVDDAVVVEHASMTSTLPNLEASAGTVETEEVAWESGEVVVVYWPLQKLKN